MDFALSEEQKHLKALSRRIFGDYTTAAQRKRYQQDPTAFLAELWSAAGEAGLLGITLPDDMCGSGLDAIDLCVVLEELGYAAAPLPILPHLILGAMPLALFADKTADETLGLLVASLATGKKRITGAFESSVRATNSRLTGTVDLVPALMTADYVVVSAQDENGAGLYLAADLAQSGVRRESAFATHDDPVGRLVLENAAATRIGGAEAVSYTLSYAHLGLSAMALGAAKRALMLTAAYTTERKQFDRPIGTFQAVSQRAGDAYINVQAMRLSLYRAAWLLANDRPARTEIAVARYWATEGGHRVLTAAQHLHGGIGFDRDYPLYRYFLLTKQLEFTLGCASEHLERIAAETLDHT